MRAVSKLLVDEGLNVHSGKSDDWWSTAELLAKAADEIEAMEVERLATIGRERAATMAHLLYRRDHELAHGDGWHAIHEAREAIESGGEHRK